jgi:hypothetical protein
MAPAIPTTTLLATKPMILLTGRLIPIGLGLVAADGHQTHAELGATNPPRQHQLEDEEDDQRVIERPVHDVAAPRRQRQGEPARAVGQADPVGRDDAGQEQERDRDDDECRATGAQRYQSEADRNDRGDQPGNGDPYPR